MAASAFHRRMNILSVPDREAERGSALDRGPAAALAAHWPEYLIEALALAVFMLSACIVGTLLEHPMSPLRQSLEDSFLRRLLAGIAIGSTAIAIICSPWGQRSGAHLNPGVTWAYFLLGKIAPWDALFYAGSQFLGAIAGVAAAGYAIGEPIRHSAVNHVVTKPGMDGETIAFGAEFLISAILMCTILTVSNNRWLTRYTPLFAGSLVALFIAFESPLSGMSMNPARTLGSAFAANEWTALWIYFVAPPLGMMTAALVYRASRGPHRVFCAKLHHHNRQRCIFRCDYGSLYDQ